MGPSGRPPALALAPPAAAASPASPHRIPPAWYDPAMARRLARWTLLGIKGALAVVALAALVVWPWSYGHPMRVLGERWTVASDQVNAYWINVESAEGWLGLGRGGTQYVRDELDVARQRAGSHGAGWTWARQPGWSPWYTSVPDESAGPIRDQSSKWGGVGWTSELREIAFPCWLLALLTGAWPLASALLTVRRRRRTSLRLRLNLCRHCGYDLRATPSAGGATLATCPECGTAAGKSEFRIQNDESMTKHE